MVNHPNRSKAKARRAEAIEAALREAVDLGSEIAGQIGGDTADEFRDFLERARSALALPSAGQ